MAIRSHYANSVFEARVRAKLAERDGPDLPTVRRLIADASAISSRRSRLPKHQKEAAQAMAAHFLGRGDARSLVVIPAAGERPMFPEIIRAMQSVAERKFPNVIVLTPTLATVSRTVRDLQAVLPKGFVGHLASKSIGTSDQEPIRPGVGVVTVIPYAGFIAFCDEEKIKAGDVDLIVMEEAHQGLSDTRREVLEKIFDDSAVTAFTGTPAFDDFKDLRRFLGDGNQVYSISAQELRNRGVIPPICNFVVAVNLRGDAPGDSAEALVLKREAITESVRSFLNLDAAGFEDLRDALDHRVTLFYGNSRAHAKMYADRYDEEYRKKHALGALRKLRTKVERETGRKHNRKRSIFRDDMLEEFARRFVKSKGDWNKIPEKLRSATTGAEFKEYFVRMCETLETMPTPMAFLSGDDSRERVDEVIEGARTGRIKAIASAQMLHDIIEIPNVGVVVGAPTESLLECLQQADHVQRGPSGRIGYVINPFIKINRKIENYPRFFFEASGDYDMGRRIETDPIYFENIVLDEAARRPKTAPPPAASASQDAPPAFPAPSGSASQAPAPSSVGLGLDDLKFGSEELDPSPPSRTEASTASADKQPAVAPPTPRTQVRFVGHPAPASKDRRRATMKASKDEPDKPRVRWAKGKPEDARLVSQAYQIDSTVRLLLRQRDLYRKAKDRDPAFLSLREASAHFGVALRRNGPLSRAYRLLEEDMANGGDPTNDGNPVFVDNNVDPIVRIPVRADVYKDGDMLYLGVHKQDIEEVGRRLELYPNLPRKNGRWLTEKEAALQSQCPLSRVHDIFQDLAMEWTSTGSTRDGVQFSLVHSGDQRVFAIEAGSLGWLQDEVQRRRPAKRRSNESLCRDACISVFGHDKETTKRAEALWDAATERARKNSAVDAEEKVAFRIAQEGQREVGVLADTGFPWFARKLGVPYHAVIGFDAAVHATLADAMAILKVENEQIEVLTQAYNRLRHDLAAKKPVIVDGEQVSATLVRVAGDRSPQFALPKDCLPALAHELGIHLGPGHYGIEEEPAPQAVGM